MGLEVHGIDSTRAKAHDAQPAGPFASHIYWIELCRMSLYVSVAMIIVCGGPRVVHVWLQGVPR